MPIVDVLKLFWVGVAQAIYTCRPWYEIKQSGRQIMVFSQQYCNILSVQLLLSNSSHFLTAWCCALNCELVLLLRTICIGKLYLDWNFIDQWNNNYISASSTQYLPSACEGLDGLYQSMYSNQCQWVGLIVCQRLIVCATYSHPKQF